MPDAFERRLGGRQSSSFSFLAMTEGAVRYRDNLLVGKSALPHVRSFLGKRTLLTFSWHATGEQVTSSERHEASAAL